MRISIHVYGTRGDVQPYLALAKRLLSGGHEVQLVGPRRYAYLAFRHRVQYQPLPNDMLDLLDTTAGRRAVGGGIMASFMLLKHVRGFVDDLLKDEWQAAHDFWPDLIIFHPKSIASPHMAERIGCRSILASPLPILTPTSEFPSPMFPVRSLGPFNRLSHEITRWLSTHLFPKSIARWRRKTLGLREKPLRSHKPASVLYAYSRHLVPFPRDWGRNVHVTGPWWLEEPGWKAPTELEAFLAGGAPPVYVGFGSMPGVDPARLTGMVVKAVARLDKRVLLSTAGGALAPGPSSSRVFTISDAPHHHLFERVDATFHHGGAGTTAEALRAGKPTLICPVFGDQPFWANRIQSLGVGPPPLKLARLSVDSIAAALRAMDDPAVRARARQLGSQIRDENGVDCAAHIVDRLGWAP
ncbi:glycosyltransferase [Ensifer sp. ZNC0028]|uniref:glycosyltransferase n=1 Tax=Ensifer sp. ZNC0028 TaxID=1339236 RepID=UPI0009DDB2B2|nr:glycosyltransferase [Ensifer sp. ZNC0028]